jgi:adenosylmethionine-8-amino-7-oxononanoate aminotransferase
MFDRPADGIMKAPVIGARRDLPVHSGGQGIYQHAADGRRFIDAASGAMVSNLGHGNAEVVRAVTEQLAKGPFAYRLHFRSEAVEAYAEALAARCPDGLDRCYFVSGGSEAIEAALKLARQAAIVRGERDRWKVISRYPGYHGTTFGALSATGYDPLTDPFEPFLARMPRVPVPVTWRDRAGRSDAEIAQAAAAALDAAIIREGAGTVLAFLMEPVGGASTGALVSPDAYFPAVREVCDRHGVLLIHDEVMCGAGRTGAFLAGDHWGCRPDILVLVEGNRGGICPARRRGGRAAISSMRWNGAAGSPMAIRMPTIPRRRLRACGSGRSTGSTPSPTPPGRASAFSTVWRVSAHAIRSSATHAARAF